jgi:hypothetical protein
MLKRYTEGFMDYYKLKQKLLILAGALLVGALGSGLWEVALKPSLMWVATLVLDIATLGMNSLRDGLYLDVAKGSYERASLMSMSLLFGLFSGTVIGATLVRLSRNKRKEETTSANRVTRKWIFMGFSVSMSIFLVIQVFRVSYIIRASNFLDQLERMVSPYVTENQLKTFDSRIARMKSRDEYLAISSELTTAIKSQGFEPPTFNVY